MGAGGGCTKYSGAVDGPTSQDRRRGRIIPKGWEWGGGRGRQGEKKYVKRRKRGRERKEK